MSQDRERRARQPGRDRGRAEDRVAGRLVRGLPSPQIFLEGFAGLAEVMQPAGTSRQIGQRHVLRRGLLGELSGEPRDIAQV